MTSELSNALNPHVIQTRSRGRIAYVSLTQHTQTPQAPPEPRPYAPHRSELELAITEPPPVAQQPPPQPLSNPPQPPPNPLREIIRVLVATKEADVLEKQRRMAWEKEQEERFSKREAELEKQVQEMQEEIDRLKAHINSAPSPSPSGVYTPIALSESETPSVGETFPEAPLSPESTSFHQVPQFVEGSSRHAFTEQTRPLDNSQEPSPGSGTASEVPLLAYPLTPRGFSAEPTSLPSTAQSNVRKRHSPPMYSDSEEESTSDTSDASPMDNPKKRRNGHDKSIRTVHHAMRKHVLRIMKLETDKHLPDSHVEGDPLPDDGAVRFIWEKTPKQSAHNNTMKKRAIITLKERRARKPRLYKFISDSDFKEKRLEDTFDQVFTTLRQKFKAQRDELAAVNHKRKEDHKAMKVRRLSRKKTKLANRTEIRKRIEAFSHPTFDGALMVECMSSEESCDEYSEPAHPSGALTKVQVLRRRGLPWRSFRLMRFYAHLDEEEQVERSFKPKRGIGRKERCIGPMKDGFYMPPKGVASWMVSQRWIRGMRIAHPDLLELLKDTVVDPPGFDWSKFGGLGEESGEELEEPEPEPGYVPRSETSYSLAHALAPI